MGIFDSFKHDRQPSFMAPLTSRGKKLVRLISSPTLRAVDQAGTRR